MIKETDIGIYLQSELPLIDVRSPGEYEKGHIPGAVNIPLFTDSERAEVGTVYVQQSKEKAVELGYKFVNPKLGDFILQSKKLAPSGKVAVHCWRGGMRSQSFAGLLNENGFTEVVIINGGYKAYRNHVLEYFAQPFRLQIIGGYTGSGKTEIIKYLQQNGHQAIDLEGLAHHRGSAFGGLSQFAQPSVEQFENNLFNELQFMDRTKIIWLEDESHNIGKVTIPIEFFKQIKQSQLFFVEIPKVERAAFLVSVYAGNDAVLLAEGIRKISKRLGGQNINAAFTLLENKEFYELAYLLLGYYDKTYLKGLNNRNPVNIFIIPCKDTNPVENAKSVINQYNGNN